MPNNLQLPTAPKGLQKGLAVLKRLKIPEGARKRMPKFQLPEMEEWRQKTREFVGRRGSRSKPTDYPFLVFHSVRSLQLLSSIVTMSIMSYFMYHLKADGIGLPWTFILLLTVSILTVLSLTGTIVLHCFYGLNPKLNVALNGSLLFLWTLGFALLTWWASSTLGHMCTVQRWGNDTGVGVCRTYKALFSFSLFGFISTLAAALLDIYVFRRTIAKGKYNQMMDLPELDRKTATLPDPREFSQHEEETHEAQPQRPSFEPTRSPLRPRSIKDAPTGDSATKESPYDAYDAFKPDLVVPAPKSNASSSRRPSRDEYAPVEAETYDEPESDERVPHAETR